MSPRRHVDDLFTAALDDDLSPIDDARFHAHIRSCADCAAAYTEFTATVQALRELPKVRMARVVHLPSTPPVAEVSPRRGISLGWLNAGLLRRFPATALAGAAAVVLIIVALAHAGANTATTNQLAGSGDQGVAPAVQSGAVQPGSVTQEAACTSQITAITGASPPAGFSKPEVVTAPTLPGAHLVLSASSLSVTSGQNVTVYAQLSIPQVTFGAPGTTSSVPASHSLRPCVTVTVGGSSKQLSVFGSATGLASGSSAGGAGPVAESPAPGAPLPASGGGQPLFVFTVPAGVAHGTVLHVTATIPAGYEGVGSPALTAVMTITTQ